MTRAEGARSFAVIGGGVSGMAAARLLAGAAPLGDAASAPGDGSARRSEAPPAGVKLFEASNRLGGKVLTGDDGESPLDLGPDQFLRRNPVAERWCRALGLGDSLVAPAARRAGIFSYGKSRPFPSRSVLGIPLDPGSAAATGAVSREAAFRGALDRVLPGRALTAGDVGLEGEPEAPDERSAGSILRSRLGDELVDRLVDPILGGINAGRLDSLSLGTVAPGVAGALVGHHDVLGPLSKSAAPRVPSPPADHGDSAPTSADRAPDPRGDPSPFYGLIGGLGRMTEAGEAELSALGVVIRKSAAVRSLSREADGFGLRLADGRRERFDGVVMALPPREASALIKGLSAPAAALLSCIRSAGVSIVSFGFAPEHQGVGALPPTWSGLVVPAVEGLVTTALTFTSQKWPSTARRSLVYLRASCGRLDDSRCAQLDDDELCRRLLAELPHMAGISGRPLTSRVQRWPSSFPSYAPGHRRLVARLRVELGSLPGLAIAGALLGGIGIPACIESGEAAALAVLGSARGSRS